MRKRRQVSRSTHTQRTKTSNSVRPWKTVRPAREFELIAYSIKDKVGNDPNCGIFAVFDGHGGRPVADHCAERVSEELKKEIMKTSGDLSQAIDSVFLKV